MQRGFSPKQKGAGVESAQVRELAALSRPAGRRRGCDDTLEVRGAKGSIRCAIRATPLVLPSGGVGASGRIAARIGSQKISG